MGFRREHFSEEISVANSGDEYANCVVCHDRNTGNLIELWLPVSKTTICKTCAKELSNKITNHIQ